VLRRKRIAELMDDPLLDRDLHLDALRGLERLNAVSNSKGLLTGPIETLAAAAPAGKSVKVLDIACGAGDLAFEMSNYFTRRALNVEIHGLDISDLAISYAEQKNAQAQEPQRCKFTQLDVMTDDLPEGYDVITTSLFTHHLDPPQISSLLAKMAKCARHMILVNDLERSYTSLYSVILATRLLTRSPIVHHDGAASVRAAFTPGEMLAMAKQAGLSGAKIRRAWPCRMLLSWVKNNHERS